MKRGIGWTCAAALAALVATGCGGESAETKGGGGGAKVSREDAVKKRLQELFDIAKGGDFAAAAGYVVYHGPDKARDWKDVCSYGDENEKRRVDSVCRKIKERLEKHDGFAFTKFRTEKESEGEWLLWEVTFGKGDSTRKAMFACLEIKGNYAVGDVD